MLTIVKRQLKPTSIATKQAVVVNFIQIWNRDSEIAENCKKCMESQSIVALRLWC